MNSENVVLLAENLPDDEFLFHYTLRRAGLDNPVVVVRDGAETVAYLKGEGKFADPRAFPLPRILMLDLAMPRISGWQILKWLRSEPQFDELLVVVLTASSQVEDLRRAYQLGANSFLTKPCSLEDLVNLANGYPHHWFHPAEMLAVA